MSPDDAEKVEWFRFIGIAGFKRFMPGKIIALAMRNGRAYARSIGAIR